MTPRHSYFFWLLVLAHLLLASVSNADEIRPAYLQLTETKINTFDVLFRVPARGGEQRLALDAVFDQQTQNITQPVGGYDGGAHNTFWAVKRNGGLTGASITITNLESTSTEVLLRIAYLDGSATVHRMTPDAPTYVVEARATWMQVITTYFRLGVEHILFGVDHLLFVFVLLLLVRNMRKLVITITAFTIAHSITLILASLEFITVPVPPVEACIALSIAFVATEIIRGQQGHPGITAQYPWIVAFSFGLLHGLGFAAALSEVGLPQNAIVSALLIFNVGVEAGQLLFVLFVLSLWQGIKRVQFSVPAWLERAPAYTIGGLASFWVFERIASFWA